jgi:O-antigen ligase
LIWLALVRTRHAVLLVALVTVLAIVFAPATLSQRFNAQSTASTDIPLRADIWGGAVDVYSRQPILGVGLDNFSLAYAALPSTLADASQRRLLNQSGLQMPTHAQNLYLNVLAEQGIVGLGALVLLWLGAFVIAFRGSRQRDPMTRTLCVAIGAGLVILSIHSVLEVTLLTELALPFFALLAACARLVALESAAEERV